MRGYLSFLQSLTEFQQKSEVERLVLSQSQGSLAEDILKHPTVVAFDESLGFQPKWKFETKQFDVEAGEIGVASFFDDQCVVPILLRYENLICSLGCTTTNLEYRLFVDALVYIDNDGDAMVGNISCSSNHLEVRAEIARCEDLQRHDYMKYLRMLTPPKRSFAIFHLAENKWGMDTPNFFYSELSNVIENLGIDELVYDHHEVGPVEFEGNSCTALITYMLYCFLPEVQDEYPEAKYYAEIHILARISNRLSRSGDDIGGELSVENISFAVIPIEDHEQTQISIIS
jgi:hypothetical protein